MPVNLESRFPDISREMRPQISAAVKESAEAVRDRAKALVVKDQGDLMRAIHIERVGPGEYRVVGGDDDEWYGHIIEYGAHGVGRPRKDEAGLVRRERRELRRELGTGVLPPRPFLLPALEYERLRIAERVEDALNDIRGAKRG
jgi:hypothetical protein